MERKKEIRRRMLDKRSRLSEREWKDKTDRITEKITGHPWFLEADALYCYVDFKGEVGTREIIERAWQSKKKVYVPAVSARNMEFYQIFSFLELEKGTYGILEPYMRGRERKADIVRDGRVLIILPGAVFDEKRNRIGYGGGYYDRYLASCVNFRVHTIAAAFEFQVTEKIETEKTDISPELLVTERRIL